MKKEIVIADVHIDDFRSDIPGSRLNNYLKLAEIIRDKAIELKSDWIFIAGDLVNRPVLPPHILDVVKKFLSTLLESGVRIAFITGQHDQNAKELETLKDTYLGIFCDSRIFYANGHTLIIEGTKIYFENFTRSSEVDPKKESDVFISHVTLGHQKVNNSKFKLGVFGDIHDVIDIENMHSVCPPICIHAHEKSEGVIGILTVGIPEPKFERFEYDPEFKIFPKLEREVREVKTKEELSEEDKKILDILSCKHDFYKDIENVVKSLGLEDIHNEIDTSQSPEPISFDFKITDLYARNFKSIEDLSLSFDDLGKLTFISGRNGSGKTSIIEALYVALLGERRLADKYQSKWAKEDIMVGVKLTFKGSKYEICRGKGWTKFFINDQQIQRANKTALEAYINQVLPFLSLIETFYIKTYEHFFDKDRVSLVKKCFNLDIFDYFYQQGKSLYSSIESELSKELDRNNQLKGKYDQERLQKETIIKTLEEYSDVDVSEYESVNSEIYNLREKLKERSICKGRVESLKSQISKLEPQTILPRESKSDLISFKSSLEEENKLSINIRTEKRNYENLKYLLSCLKTIECPNCKTKIDIGENKRADIEDKLKSSETLLKEYQQQFKQITDKNIPYSINEIDKLLKTINQVETIKTQLEKLNFDLKSEYRTLSNLDDELELMPIESDLQAKIIKIEKKKILLQGKLNSETAIRDIINSAKICKQERERLKEKLSRCEKYMNLFSMKNLDSIPYRLLVKISEFLSTDKIRFKTYSQLGNGNLVLDISCELKVGNEYINYDSCSHGQKTMMDFFILSRFLELLNGIGLITIDEGLSVLNPEMYNEACETIKSFNANNIFITSHQLGFTDYDSMILCNIDNEGKTSVELS